MPLPPVTPPPVNPPVVNPPVINTDVSAFGNGDVRIEPTNKSNSRSISEAENTVVQDVNQSNYNINNNHNNYVQYHNGSRTPVPTWTHDFVYNPSNGDAVYRTGIHIPLGGKSTKLVHKTVRLDNAVRTASACAAIIQQGIEIDYEIMPELSQCAAFKQKTVIAQGPNTELTLLRQQILEQQKLIKQQQETLIAFKLRLEQMKHEVKQVPATW